MNTITIELCAEDRQRLDRILTALEGNSTPATAEPVREQLTEAKPADMTPVDEAPPQEWTAPEYKLSDIQQKVVALAAAGKKAEVREIIKAYAPKVSELPDEKFGEIMAKLAELEK